MRVRGERDLEPAFLQKSPGKNKWGIATQYPYTGAPDRKRGERDSTPNFCEKFDQKPTWGFEESPIIVC
jgi:hypothetical protein